MRCIETVAQHSRDISSTKQSTLQNVPVFLCSNFVSVFIAEREHVGHPVQSRVLISTRWNRATCLQVLRNTVPRSSRRSRSNKPGKLHEPRYLLVLGWRASLGERRQAESKKSKLYFSSRRGSTCENGRAAFVTPVNKFPVIARRQLRAAANRWCDKSRPKFYSRPLQRSSFLT